MYIVLGVLYESFIHPITILSTLPSAGVGALLALMLLHYDLNVIAIIGIVLLIGIVKKNAIMMIDFALDAERNEGMPPREAIYQACLLRFRPIMMTTMAAILGALPLMLGTGAGSELRQPLGIAIVGGLGQPIADAVHDAGDLPLFRPASAAPERRRPANPLATGEPARMNLSAPFIARPVATTLLTIGSRSPGCRDSRGCRCRRCLRSTFRRFRCRRRSPAPVPKRWPPPSRHRSSAHLGHIADVTEMTSQQLGQARITLQFDLNRDIDGAARDVAGCDQRGARCCRRACQAIRPTAR